MSKSKKISAIILCIVLVFAVIGASAYITLGYSQPYGEIETYTVGDGQSLKVGILSDSQLPGAGGENDLTKKLEETLLNFKKQDVNVIVHAGDFTDLATKEAWQSFVDTYEKVYKENGPVKSFILGNHDHWLDYFTKCWEVATPAKMQKRFMKYTGEKPYSHKVINGYHFIGWSSSNGSYDKCNTNVEWIKEQLDIAVKDDAQKPIFVITHLNPKGTVFGSEDWGNEDIYNVLKDYPQVVSLSGHSHYSLLDERSIYQGEFTAVNTQTIDYVTADFDKENGGIPSDAYGNNVATDSPMAMIMQITDSKVEINRMNAVKGDFVKSPWVLTKPYDKSTFKYTNEIKTAGNKSPYFDVQLDAQIKDAKNIDGEKIKILSFNAAKDDDFVYSYKLIFKDKNGKLLEFKKSDDENAQNVSQAEYLSDFVGGLDKMSNRAELRLPKNLPDTAAIITVSAIDSYGEESAVIDFIIE